MFRGILRDVKPANCLIAFFSSAFLAFGLFHVHSMSGVTEGGVLGLTLLLEHWFDISPSVSGMILNFFCYALGWRTLGRSFIVYSVAATFGFSASYKLWEQFDPFWPELAEMPFVAAVVGAIFVGIGAGLCVRAGGATGGDDALAMSLAKLTHWNIEWIYLFSDITVLALSVSYIPLGRIGYSLLTVILSGQIIGLIQKIKLPKRHSNKQ